MPESESKAADKSVRPTLRPVALADPDLDPVQAEEILQGLAGVFTHNSSIARRIVYPPEQLAERARRRSASSPTWKPDIVPWWSRFRPWCSWPIWIAA